MKHLFILNPKAGSDEAKSGIKALIEEKMIQRGAEYEIYYTTAPMDAAEKVRREALKGEELRVYACGGDGTISECAHGAAGFSNCAVTHFPCGTGNDFIKSFDGDTELFRSLDELIDGAVFPIDLIDVNGRKCLDIASVGLDARIGTDVHKYSGHPVWGKIQGGYIPSLVMNILKGINSEFTFETEEGEMSGKFALACCCNGKYYGGGFNPTRTAVVDDGVLEILIIKKVNLIQLAALLGDYSAGLYYKHPDFIKHIGGTRLKVTAPQKFVVNIDGEAMYTKEVTMKLIPKGVNFIFPKSSNFVKERT
ncbi:MAG: YegS/Rv2252/BmrU family lipid kinase [Oscillospiraceae bacterium]|nr:YegS/Rv2252/BmrU family lipid kinase [Oscillospiraceae bacterium]